MIRFDFQGLTPSQSHALSVLIDNGGAARADLLCVAANNAPGGHPKGVTKPTILSLVRRGYLDFDEAERNRVQVSDWALTMAFRNPGNPNPLPVMLARAEALAAKESATRTADMIKETWTSRNTESKT